MLNGELVSTLQEARVLVERWRQTSNQVHPHHLGSTSRRFE